MLFLDNSAVLDLVDRAALVSVLRQAFLDPAYTPPRFHGDLPGESDAKLLVMPSWSGREAVGVKVITVIPSNSSRGEPTIDGIYILMDGQTGHVLAAMHAGALTALRTAAVCALATSMLARQSAKTLLIVGTGTLAPHLVRAYLAVRNLQRVIVWGRDPRKSAALVAKLSDLPIELGIATDLPTALSAADIICSATMARAPLILGRFVAPGTHVDLVGSFTPEMREADTELFRRGRAFVDSDTALKESGDIAVPLQEGVLAGPIPDLTDLLRLTARGRSREDEITIFKSVGTGLADLAAARHVLERYRARHA